MFAFNSVVHVQVKLVQRKINVGLNASLIYIKRGKGQSSCE